MMMRKGRHVSRRGCVLPVLHSYTINTLHDDDDDDDDNMTMIMMMMMMMTLRITQKEEILHSHYCLKYILEDL